MIEYKIIETMKIQNKTVAVLNKARDISDFDKPKVVVADKAYSYSITHNALSIIIDTVENLNGEIIHFE
ncbi:MAG: hypothetical protein E7494_00945 [Ruminococcus albus]|jgi:hypothetical protein|nr:hypothetical protein [Ruminococcus albus]